MANLEKLAARLNSLNDGKRNALLSKLIWKPKEGTQKIRIVDYQFNPDTPFIDLQFYYEIAGRYYLAPCTFGKPDPFQELAETLNAAGSEEERNLARKLRPTPRTYLPIIVRGEEDQGVKFWGFSKTINEQLTLLVNNREDWGDILSYTDGNDLTVEYKKNSGKKNPKTGQIIPEIKVSPVPKKTPVVDPTRKDLLVKINTEQTDILEIFKLKTYEELKKVIDQWLNPEVAPETVDATPDAEPVADVPVTPSTVPSADNDFDKFFSTSKS
jgi:hypothetical protein